mgnify:FL=1
MKQPLLILFFSFLSFVLHGQEEAIKKRSEKISLQGFSLGFTPSAALNIYPAFQISADYGFSKSISLTNEIGFIPDTKKLGYRWRPGILFNALRSSTGGVSLGLAYNTRKAFVTTEEEILHAQGQFTEKVMSSSKYALNGFVAQGYFYIRLVPQCFIRFGMGLGSGQYVSRNMSNEPILDNNIFRIRDGRFPILYLHLNVQYQFAK